MIPNIIVTTITITTINNSNIPPIVPDKIGAVLEPLIVDGVTIDEYVDVLAIDLVIIKVPVVSPVAVDELFIVLVYDDESILTVAIYNVIYII